LSDDHEPWLMRVTGGLSAHFKQADGPSRPGTDWAIGLKRGAEEHAVTVRTYTVDDLPATLKDDSAYLARTAMGYLNDLLNQGWDPSEPRVHEITVGHPREGAPPPPRKPFWKVW
jgi:hypothetical protein